MERNWIFGLGDRSTLVLVLLAFVAIPAVLSSWPPDLAGPTAFLIGCYILAVAWTGWQFLRARGAHSES
jgi:protein-S-isoprenylcysteine O-methyltransferase Ste14